MPVSRRLTKQMSTKQMPVSGVPRNEKAAERPKSVRSLIVNEMLMTEQTCGGSGIHVDFHADKLFVE